MTLLFYLHVLLPNGVYVQAPMWANFNVELQIGVLRV